MPSTTHTPQNDRSLMALFSDLLRETSSLVHNEAELRDYVRDAVRVSKKHPLLVDQFLGRAIEIDVDARELRVDLAVEEIEKRLADWVAPAPRYARGVFAKYAQTVGSASRGAVTSP